VKAERETGGHVLGDDCGQGQDDGESRKHDGQHSHEGIARSADGDRPRCGIGGPI
jgi:hypothetical protein